MKKISISGMLFLLLFFIIGAQTQTKIDYEAMNRDLRIMEKILGSLLADDNNYIGVGEIKGIYLDNYGVVFNVPIYRKATEQAAIKLQTPPDDPQARAQIEKKVNEEVQRIEISKLLRSTSTLRSSIKVFFGSYADVIKQLEPNDVITVFAIAQEGRGGAVSIKSGDIEDIRMRGSAGNEVALMIDGKIVQNPVFGGFAEKLLNSFLMSVKKDDITRYRKKSISLSKFYEAVSYAAISGSNITGTAISKDLATDIKVMKGIIETVLEDTLRTSIPSQSVQSAYLKNYGILYFVDVGYIPSGVSSTSLPWAITEKLIYNPGDSGISSTSLSRTILSLFELTLTDSARVVGRIEGYVKDRDTNAPLIGVNVVIEGTDPLIGAATDQKGYYKIINVSAGTYTLRASYVGYGTQKYEKVIVQPDLVTTVNFDLSEKVTVEEIKIHGELELIKRDLMSKVATMNYSEIIEMPVSDLTKLLQTQSNIQVLTGTPYQKSAYEVRGLDDVRMRGSRNNEVALLIDGMMVQNPIFGGFATKPALFSIDQMNVQSGGFDASYGNALTGVVNITTREGGTRTSGTLQYDTGRPFGIDALATEPGQASNSHNINFTMNGPIKFIPKLKYSLSLGFGSASSSSFFFDDIIWDDARGSYPTTLELENAYAKDGTLLVSAAQAQAVLTPLNTYGRTYMFINPIDCYIGWRGYGWNNSVSMNTKLTYNFTSNLKLNVNFAHSQTYAQPLSTGTTGNRDNSGVGRNDMLYHWPVGRWAWVTSSERLLRIDTDGSVTGVIGKYYLNQYPKLDYYEYAKADPPKDIIGAGLYYNKSGLAPMNVNFTQSQTYSFNMSHVLGSNTVYYVNGQLFQSQRRVRILINYEQPYKYSWWKYAPDWDNIKTKWEYLYSSYWMGDPWEGSWFYYLGDWYWYDGDKTLSAEGKVDFRTNITQRNQLSTGVSFKYMELAEDEYQSTGGVSTSPVIYHMFPKEAAAYIQNTYDLSSIVMNFGLRLDFANAGGSMWRNPLDPVGHDFDLYDGKLEYNSYVTAKRKFKLAPRFRVSFPLTDMTFVRFNFGHFYQAPNYRDLYRDTGQLELAMRSGDIVGNTSLEYEKAINYEFGVQQQIGNLFSIDATLWLRETQNQVGSVDVPNFSDPGADNPYYYSVFLNYNFGSSRGLDVSFTKRFSSYYSASLNYSWSRSLVLQQTSWDGYWESETFAMMPKRMTVPDWDQPHSLRGTVSFELPPNFGPTVLGFKPMSSFGTTLTYSGNSGYNYTPSTYSSAGVGEVSQTRQLPFQHSVSARIRKSFSMLDYQCQLSMSLGNIFNTRPTNQGFTSTGRGSYPLPGDYSGYSVTRMDGLSQMMFGQGRNISFGFRVNF